MSLSTLQPKNLIENLIASSPNSAERLKRLTSDERSKLNYAWRGWARKDQLPPPGDWSTWLMIGGRGAGKTRAGAEWVRHIAETNPGIRIALVAATHSDLLKVILEGDSGIMNICPPWARPTLTESPHVKVVWPNGSQAEGFSAEKPDRLRGPQFGAAWCDDMAAWHHKRRQECWDMLQFGLRLGETPKCLVTTTPKPDPLMKELIGRASDPDDPEIVMTTGSTYANRRNLAPGFFRSVVAKYEGSKLGEQELHGVLIDKVEGALWQYDWISENRVTAETPDLARLVVSFDPSGSVKGDASGLIVAGRHDNDYYVLRDATAQFSPTEAARKAIQLFDDYEADALVWETNFGRDWVETTMKATAREMYHRGERDQESIPLVPVSVFRGKVLRAEPVAHHYEMGRVHHLHRFQELEEEMQRFTYDWDRASQGSPNRVDALTMAITELEKSAPSSMSIGFGTASLTNRRR